MQFYQVYNHCFVMKKFLSKSEAIISMHEKGYTEDFRFLGNNMLWVQKQRMMAVASFMLAECCLFLDEKGAVVYLLALTTERGTVKGIVIPGVHSGRNQDPVARNRNRRSQFFLQ
jgi:hypothetical protein